MSDTAEGWSVAKIAGKSADVFEPPGEQTPRSAVIYLHDADLQTPVGDDVLTGLFTRFGLRCICPHGGQSWWLDRVSREFDAAVSPMTFVREQILPWIKSRWQLTPPGIGLLGTGMGGQGALQLAYRHARTFPVVAAMSPVVDFHLLHGQGGPLDELFPNREAARQQTATLHLHPLNWPPHQLFVCPPDDPLGHEGCQRLASKLASIGIPFESDLETSRSGGPGDYERQTAQRCVSFVAEALSKLNNRENQAAHVDSERT